MNPNLPIPSSRGAALLEAMISMTLLLVGMIAMIQLQIIGLQASNRGRSQARATQYASEMVSTIPQMPLKDAWGWEPQELKSFFGPSMLPPPNFDKPVYSRMGDFFDTNNRYYTPWWGSWAIGTERDENMDGYNNDYWIDYLKMPKYLRFWMVWDYIANPGDTSRVKIFAISVVHRPAPRSTPEEYMTFTTRVDTAGMMTDVEASAY
jgi:type IV pilus assembly protein PilV